jgi:5-methylcytosine-specific restriction protein A
MSAPSWLTKKKSAASTTEIPAWIRETVVTRAGRHCESCGGPCYLKDHALHHRRVKGMGGSKDAATHTVSNLVLVCASCHRAIHENPEQARDAGWLVRQGADPARVAVLLHNGRSVLLGADGHYLPYFDEEEAS